MIRKANDSLSGRRVDGKDENVYYRRKSLILQYVDAKADIGNWWSKAI